MGSLRYMKGVLAAACMEPVYEPCFIASRHDEDVDDPVPEEERTPRPRRSTTKLLLYGDQFAQVMLFLHGSKSDLSNVWLPTRRVEASFSNRKWILLVHRCVSIGCSPLHAWKIPGLYTRAGDGDSLRAWVCNRILGMQ